MIDTKEATETAPKQAIRHEIKLITPEIAADFLSRNVRNRRMMKSTVDSYAVQMQRGEWQLTPQGISFNEYNELIDGQHRAQAVVQSGASVEMFVFYNVPDETFKVLDTGNKRTASQVFQMEGIKYHMEITSGLKRFLMMQKTTTNHLSRMKGSSKISSTYLLDYYRDNMELVENVLHLACDYYRVAAFYPKSEIIGVIMYLHVEKKHSLSLIEGFFNQLFHGRLVNNIGIEMLRSKLIQSALLKSHTLNPSSKIIFLKQVWNAFIENKNIKRLSDEIDPKNPIDFN